MKKNKTFLLTLFLSAAPLWAGLILFSRLPAQIPSHWNFSGQPDSYTDKSAFVFGIGALMIVLQLAIFFAIKLDPKSNHLSPIAIGLSHWIIPFLSILLTPLTYGTALGMEFSINRVITLALSLLFLVIGNYLPKVRQNYTIGIRVPWTLNDENNWDATHRFGGRVMFVCSIAAFVFALLGLEAVCLVLFCISALAPCIYSYLYYKKHPKGE